jgi:hypothetical protein
LRYVPPSIPPRWDGSPQVMLQHNKKHRVMLKHNLLVCRRISIAAPHHR